MDLWDSGASLLKSFERSSAEVLEFVTQAVAGSASSLRDGTEHDPVVLPRDLAAHSNAQTEWWYYTGHAETTSGRRFGFELVFFKRRTDLDNFSIVPLRLIGNPYYFAHFAISDVDDKSFRYAHRKSANGPLELPASANEQHYHLRLGDWSAAESNGLHVLRATLDDSTVFEATVRPEKPVVLNGENGVSFKDKGEASRYFSYTRMALEGDLIVDGNIEHFTGSSWMDREFGTWEPTENQKGWDWFSIQLDNGAELMCYQLRDGKGDRSAYSSGTFVEAGGAFHALKFDEFEITELGYWTSENSSAKYPSRWKIEVPRFGISVSVEPHFDDQELDTRGTTMIVYWEGSCSVAGKAGKEAVRGNAYVELVGYDRSHDNPNLAAFLIGGQLNAFKRFSQ